MSDLATYAYPGAVVPLANWPRVKAKVGGHEYELRAVAGEACCEKHPVVGILPETQFGESVLTEDLAVRLTELYQRRVPTGMYDGVFIQHIA